MTWQRESYVVTYSQSICYLKINQKNYLKDFEHIHWIIIFFKRKLLYRPLLQQTVEAYSKIFIQFHKSKGYYFCSTIRRHSSIKNLGRKNKLGKIKNKKDLAVNFAQSIALLQGLENNPCIILYHKYHRTSVLRLIEIKAISLLKVFSLIIFKKT